MSGYWATFLNWVDANRVDIDSIGTLIGIAGAVVAIVTLWFLYKQISETRKALQAGNAYTIQREAREIIGRLQSDQKLVDYVFENDPNKTYGSNVIREANNEIGLIFHFYLSVYRQARTKSITKTLIASMGKDFNEFIENAIVRNYYDKRLRGGEDSEHQKMVEYWSARAR